MRAPTSITEEGVPAPVPVPGRHLDGQFRTRRATVAPTESV